MILDNKKNQLKPLQQRETQIWYNYISTELQRQISIYEGTRKMGVTGEHLLATLNEDHSP